MKVTLFVCNHLGLVSSSQNCWFFKDFQDWALLNDYLVVWPNKQVLCAFQCLFSIRQWKKYLYMEQPRPHKIGLPKVLAQATFLILFWKNHPRPPKTWAIYNFEPIKICYTFYPIKIFYNFPKKKTTTRVYYKK